MGKRRIWFAATTDDVKWINQCVNWGGATHEVVLKYCTCMMSDTKTQSITKWEKSHVAERKACDREAGWRQRPRRPTNASLLREWDKICGSSPAPHPP